MKTLLIAEHNNESLKSATLNALTAAQQLGNEIDILVAGSGCQGAADAAAQAEGVSRVLMADAPAFDHLLPENVAPLAARLAKSYDYVVMPATTTGKNVLPRIAALLDVQPLSDVVAVVAPDTFKRLIYAGNLLATVRMRDSIKMFTVRATAFSAAAAQGGTASIVTLDEAEDTGLASFVSEALASLERPELTSAKVVISGGRGLGSAENFQLLYGLADKLGAAVGASRAAVDAGFAPNDLQVGQTGKVVAPDLYVAVGLSGAVQHLAGMKDSKVVVAINKDADAPIFQVADYGLVADLFQAIPELEAALGAS